MSGETIWYDIADEVVDSSSSTTEDLEGEIVKAIEEKIWDKDNLAAETLENLSKDQLGEFLAKENFTESGAKSYSEIMNNKYLYFSLRAALQLIGRWDTRFYQIDWSISGATQADENNKTIDEWLKSWGGIINTKDENMVKFLQKIVWVTVDGRPGPQTIWWVINTLWYTWSNEIAEKVNKFYEWNEMFQAMKIGEFTKWDKEYKYDQSKITIWQNDENQTTINNIALTFDEGGSIITPGFEIQNWWIVIISENDNGQKDNENKKTEKNERSDDGILTYIQESWLEEDKEFIATIKTKNYELDHFEYKWRFIIIKDGKISIYSNQTTYNNMLKQETWSKRWELKKQKIDEIVLDLEEKSKKTWKDSNGNLLFESLPWVTFQNTGQMSNFKTDVIKIVKRWAYTLENGNNPFNVSSKGNIYVNTKVWKKFLEDNTIIGQEVTDMKNIEEFKKNISNEELNNIVNFLNKMNCRSAKEKFNDIEWQYWGE